MTSQHRTPAGVPTGGQFAACAHAEADVDLATPWPLHDTSPCRDAGEHLPRQRHPEPECPLAEPQDATRPRKTRPTLQTSEPIRPLDLDISPRRAKGLADMVRDGDLDLAPPYQRGSVWDEGQRCELIRSLLSQTPIPAIVLNDRATPRWHAANGTSPRDGGGAPYVAIDGRQRIETLCAWYDDRLGVPASWFPADAVEQVTATDDGPYVTWEGLSRVARMDFNQNATLPVAEATLATVEDEAAMYLRVNGAGTAQTADDMANAARVAAGGNR